MLNIGSNNLSMYMNAYLKNSGYSFVGDSKSGGTLTNMLKNNAIKRTSNFTSIADIYSGNSASTSSGSSINVDEKTLAENAAKLKKSASALSSSDLFEKDKDGNYDTDKIADAVSSMVSDYNSTIKAFANSESIPALKTGVSMTETTLAFEKSLNKIGITINKDNTLTLDKDKLKSSDMNLVKSLTSGSYSYASKMAEKAQTVNTAASASYASTYNKQGNVSAYSNAILAAMLSLQV